MSQLIQLASELKSWFPQLEPFTCLPFITRGYRDIRDSRKWSFLRQTGTIYAPAILTAGTCAVTQFSTTVTPDVTAKPTWISQAFPAPPQPSIVQEQFRITGGPIYQIVSINGSTGAITLNRPYAEATLPGASYMIYMPYQPAPAVDFVEWLSWVDPINDYRFRRKNLFRTQAEIDRRDPNRQNYSIPIWVGSLDYVNLPTDPAGTPKRPRFELWPHPVQQLSYNVEYQIRGNLTQPTDVLPTSIPDELIIAAARSYGYEFMMTQPNMDPKLAIAMIQFRRECRAEYADLLQAAKREDDNVFNSTVFENENGPTLSGPLDADYLQSHDIYWID